MEREPRKFTGSEEVKGVPGATLLDFWRWGYSQLLANTARGVVAEWLVGVALECTDRPRVEWAPADLVYRGRLIEVKSTAKWQTWRQAEKSLNGARTFSIAATQYWDEETGKFVGERKRQADVYVFCYCGDSVQTSADVLRVEEWEFYVVATPEIERALGAAESVSLSRVRTMARRCRWEELRAAVDAVVVPG